MEGRSKKAAVSVSVFSADYLHMADELGKIEKSGADLIHIDVMDGNFVELYGLNQMWLPKIHQVCQKSMDIHFMADADIEKIRQFHFDYVTDFLFHVEAIPFYQLKNMLAYARNLGKNAGIALSPGTAAKEALPYLPHVDEILVMTSEPGSSRSCYLPGMTEKVAEVRSLVRAGKREITVSVDGGLSHQTALDCLSAGADKVIIGRCFYSDPDIINKFSMEKSNVNRQRKGEGT